MKTRSKQTEEERTAARSFAAGVRDAIRDEMPCPADDHDVAEYNRGYECVLRQAGVRV